MLSLQCCGYNPSFNGGRNGRRISNYVLGQSEIVNTQVQVIISSFFFFFECHKNCHCCPRVSLKLLKCCTPGKKHRHAANLEVSMERSQGETTCYILKNFFVAF